MGLATSVRRRFALVKGEPFGRAVRIFFASRLERRRIERAKYPSVAKVAAAKPQTEGRKTGVLGAPPVALETTSAFVDADWYSRVHGIPAADAVGHFMSVGLERGAAPSAELAGPDDATLAPWAAEFLLRMRFPVGRRGVGALEPSDARALDPFSISNPRGVKIAVVTAIFGGYDRLLPIDPAWRRSADFFLVSDQAFEEPGPGSPSTGLTIMSTPGAGRASSRRICRRSSPPTTPYSGSTATSCSVAIRLRS
jgi:hypothetical protein